MNKGVTLVALSVMIIILLILAGVGIYNGKETIEKANLEGLRTNMLLVEAKAKEYVENANFKLGIGTDEQKKERMEDAKSELKGTAIEKPDYITSENPSDFVCYYKLSTEQLKEMGISNVKSDNGEYVVEYDIDNATVEIYNADGFEKDNVVYHSLEEIENLNI